MHKVILKDRKYFTVLNESTTLRFRRKILGCIMGKRKLELREEKGKKSTI